MDLFCAARPAPSRALWGTSASNPIERRARDGGWARLSRGHVSACPAWAGRRAELRESSSRDRRTHARHQLLVIAEVDGGQQDRAEHLVRLHQVMEIGAGIVARRGTGALFVERARIAGMTGVPEVDRP